MQCGYVQQTNITTTQKYRTFCCPEGTKPVFEQVWQVSQLLDNKLTCNRQDVSLTRVLIKPNQSNKSMPAQCKPCPTAGTANYRTWVIPLRNQRRSIAGPPGPGTCDCMNTHPSNPAWTAAVEYQTPRSSASLAAVHSKASSKAETVAMPAGRSDEGDQYKVWCRALAGYPKGPSAGNREPGRLRNKGGWRNARTRNEKLKATPFRVRAYTAVPSPPNRKATLS